MGFVSSHLTLLIRHVRQPVFTFGVQRFFLDPGAFAEEVSWVFVNAAATIDVGQTIDQSDVHLSLTRLYARLSHLIMEDLYGDV